MITKYTEGHVIQKFTNGGQLISQTFKAGGNSEIETDTEQTVSVDSVYHPFTMDNFTDRQKSILKMLLSYADMNVDDINESFEYINDDSHSSIIFDGEIMSELETSEMLAILELIA